MTEPLTPAAAGDWRCACGAIKDSRQRAKSERRKVPDITDAEALAVLARHSRVLAIVIPKGIPHDRVLALKAEVDAALDALVAARGPLV